MSHVDPTPSPSAAALGSPIHTSRQWTTALVPRAAGGWNFITQSYQYQSGLESEWVIVHLEGATRQLVRGPADVYSNSNFQIPSFNTAVVDNNQIRASNGRLFFPLRYGHIGTDLDDQHYVNVAYFDPTTEDVTELPSIQSPSGATRHAAVYSSVFNNAGSLIYFGTQAVITDLPFVFSVNPATLAVNVIGSVGAAASANPKYAYYLGKDEGPGADYLYVAVGQDPWELVSVNVNTGVATVLLTTTGPGSQFVELEVRSNGWSANTVSNGVTTRYWLADGAISAYPGSGAPPGGARTIAPYSNVPASPPQIDWSRGIGQVLWRPNGSSGAWTLVEYSVDLTAAATLESLIVKPDYEVLGNAEQYQGFFRSDALDIDTEWFGNWPSGVSQPAMCVVGDEVYIAAYPDAILYRYNPEETWAPDGTIYGNPSKLGTFTGGNKHADFLVRSSDGNLYCCGSRERDAVGAAIAKFNLDSQSFGAYINADLTDYNPRGFIVLDDVDRVVFSGEVLSGSLLTAAQLRVYNRALTLQTAFTVQAAVMNTGQLFRTGTPGVVVGLTNDGPYYLYRANVMTGTVLSITSLGTIVRAACQDPGGGLIYAAIGSNIVTIDPDSLAQTTMTTLANVTVLAVRTGVVYAAVGTAVYRLVAGPILTGHRSKV